jgi:hypothetical protein
MNLQYPQYSVGLNEKGERVPIFIGMKELTMTEYIRQLWLEIVSRKK